MATEKYMHPMRWRSNVPMSTDIIKIQNFAKRKNIKANRKTSDGSLEFLMEGLEGIEGLGDLKGRLGNLISQGIEAETKLQALFMRSWSMALERLPLSERPRDPAFRVRHMEFYKVAARFFNEGRNVFQMTPGLIEELEGTELADARVNDIKLPHHAFWISLEGVNCGALPGPENVIDGAYVTGGQGLPLKVVLTSRRLDVDPFNKVWPVSADPIFEVPFTFEDDENPTFDEVLQRAIVSGEIKTKPEQAVPQKDFEGRSPVGYNEDGLPIFEEMIDTGSGLKKVQMVHVARQRELAQIEFNNAAIPAVRKALSLVVNFMAFMSLEPNEVHTNREWVDIPSDFAARLGNVKKPDLVRRTEEELKRRGFNRINVVGYKPSLARQRADEAQSELAYGHFRKGHFKMQPYGPMKSLRKMIWVPRVRVRPDLNLREDAATRIYSVQGAGSGKVIFDGYTTGDDQDEDTIRPRK